MIDLLNVVDRRPDDGGIVKDPVCRITHLFKFGRMLEASETFANAAETRELKVIIAA